MKSLRIALALFIVLSVGGCTPWTTISTWHISLTQADSNSIMRDVETAEAILFDLKFRDDCIQNDLRKYCARKGFAYASNLYHENGGADVMAAIVIRQSAQVMEIQVITQQTLFNRATGREAAELDSRLKQAFGDRLTSLGTHKPYS